MGPYHSQRPFRWTLMLLTLFLALTTLTINTPEKEVPIKVELAASYEEKEEGFQGRTSLEENRGMLFIFDKEGYHPFWMKNTPLPLSLIFINKNSLIVDIKQGKPYSKKLIYGKIPYQYVLETHPNFVKKHNIQQGMFIETPRKIQRLEESKKVS